MPKITSILLISNLIINPVAWAVNRDPVVEEHPKGMISLDYGIVNAGDLSQDAQERTLVPYDPAKNQSGRYWQCVPIKAVKRDYNAHMGEDSMGSAGVETLMCDLEITIDLPEGRHIYSDRRRHPNSFCQEFDRNWSRLTSGEKIVCFNGDDPSNENDPVFGRYRAWVWNKFKTKKGSYSYF